MPRVLTRPASDEKAQIQNALNEFSLTPRNRFLLNLVLLWSGGMNLRQVVVAANARLSSKPAKDRFVASRGSVFRAVHLYISEGLEGFLREDPPKAGRRPVDPKKADAAVERMRTAYRNGHHLTYQQVAEEVGISKGKVAALAKKHGLDAKARRGQVAKTTSKSS